MRAVVMKLDNTFEKAGLLQNMRLVSMIVVLVVSGFKMPYLGLRHENAEQAHDSIEEGRGLPQRRPPRVQWRVPGHALLHPASEPIVGISRSLRIPLLGGTSLC